MLIVYTKQTRTTLLLILVLDVIIKMQSLKDYQPSGLKNIPPTGLPPYILKNHVISYSTNVIVFSRSISFRTLDYFQNTIRYS